MDYNIYNKIIYDGKYVIDNTVRIIIKKYINENINYFFKYNLVDYERPETISFDFYGDSKLHWIILLSNEIIDPFYDWVMDYQTFLKFLEAKYLPENLEPHDWHHFEDENGDEIPDPGNPIDRSKYGITNLDFNLNQVKEYRKDGRRIKEPNNEIDKNLYQVTNFMYEEQLNNNKRQIQIPIPELIDTVENDLRRLIQI